MAPIETLSSVPITTVVAPDWNMSANFIELLIVEASLVEVAEAGFHHGESCCSTKRP